MLKVSPALTIDTKQEVDLVLPHVVHHSIGEKDNNGPSSSELIRHPVIECCERWLKKRIHLYRKMLVGNLMTFKQHFIEISSETCNHTV